jgi:hypothetical protein
MNSGIKKAIQRKYWVIYSAIALILISSINCKSSAETVITYSQERLLTTYLIETCRVGLNDKHLPNSDLTYCAVYFAGVVDSIFANKLAPKKCNGVEAMQVLRHAFPDGANKDPIRYSGLALAADFIRRHLLDVCVKGKYP